jgi:enoyl reductase-like protein
MEHPLEKVHEPKHVQVNNKKTEDSKHVQANNKTIEKVNIFEDTKRDITKEAPMELVNTLKNQMEKIKIKFVHTAQAVDQCLPVLNQRPSIHDILIICYILNGGLLLKHDTDTNDDTDDEDFFHSFETKLKEF